MAKSSRVGWVIELRSVTTTPTERWRRNWPAAERLAIELSAATHLLQNTLNTVPDYLQQLQALGLGRSSAFRREALLFQPWWLIALPGLEELELERMVDDDLEHVFGSIGGHEGQLRDLATLRKPALAGCTLHR